MKTTTMQQKLDSRIDLENAGFIGGQILRPDEMSNPFFDNTVFAICDYVRTYVELPSDSGPTLLRLFSGH